MDEWGDRDPGDHADRPGTSGDGGETGRYPARGGAGAYVANDAARNGYAPPSYPSFTAASGTGRAPAAGGQAGGYEPARPGNRNGAGPGYGDQRERGAANGHGAAGYNGGGYQDSGYGRTGNGASRREAAGYDAGSGSARDGYGGSGRPGSPAYAPEFTPADYADMEEDGPAQTSRPYGRLSIYTLHEDKAREFDRLAERAAEGVRTAEPDTLVYVIHVVPKAPMQRIIYEIYRDRAAFLTHERQPHIRQFAADRASCVLATNIIDLRLKYAKVAALGPAPGSPLPPQSNRAPRIPESAAGSDGPPAAAAQHQAAQQPTAQYQAAQYQATQYAAPQYSRTQAQQPEAPGFTPAKDRYEDNSQHPTVGREQYPPAAQYGGNGNSGYGAGNGQYGAATAYSAAAGYANGGSYSSANGYQSPDGYPPGNGYAGANGYAGSAGYANGTGYSGANGYSNGSGYQSGNGYGNGNGYSAASGYSNGSSYQDGYGAAGGYSGDGAAAQGPQYTPRYRELTGGPAADGGAGGYPDYGSGSADGGRQSHRAQSAEWAPRSQDQR